LDSCAGGGGERLLRARDSKERALADSRREARSESSPSSRTAWMAVAGVPLGRPVYPPPDSPVKWPARSWEVGGGESTVLAARRAWSTASLSRAARRCAESPNSPAATASAGNKSQGNKSQPGVLARRREHSRQKAAAREGGGYKSPPWNVGVSDRGGWHWQFPWDWGLESSAPPSSESIRPAGD